MASTPRWVEAINKALEHPDNKDKIVYQVATVDADNTPHVRCHAHRGFMQPKGHPDLPLLVSSTDARAPKVSQLHANPRMEIVWWMEGTQDQFRIGGFGYIFPSPQQGAPSPIPEEATALRLLEEQHFDFEKKRREAFEGMDMALRASWCVPYAPGTCLPSYEEQKEWPLELALEHDLKTNEEKKNYERALRNFALALFEPVEVDWVVLGVNPNKRVKFTREGGIWSELEVVP